MGIGLNSDPKVVHHQSIPKPNAMAIANYRAITTKQWQTWVEAARLQALNGKLPQYIPQLGLVNPANFALDIGDENGIIYEAGDTDLTFSLMSVVKPFLWLYILHHRGWQWAEQKVGDRPSDLPFNSVEQLQQDGGYPRNTMVNSGAICLAGQIPGATAEQRCENFLTWLNHTAQCQLWLDQELLASVHSLPNPRNLAIAHLLAAKGYVEDAALALETYNQLCCLSGCLKDLFKLGLALQCPQPPLQPDTTARVKATMAKAGLYEMSEAFFRRTGFICKSGVSGLILACLPAQSPTIFACYSPPLNEEGNPVAPLALLEFLAEFTSGN
ncbi:glutaminase [Synechocystis sp. CACIAM 05]|uniref:glutaminase n=1 Tax=Synechocystis sp. CACIAM 05 TaxID=1933929 RepID=UPI00138E6D40|nr:glutaminase [Synechocystis sp. CACIAM 05]QHV00078.1 glutaminase [Synechocystis sp. CACIAM 05]